MKKLPKLPKNIKPLPKVDLKKIHIPKVNVKTISLPKFVSVGKARKIQNVLISAFMVPVFFIVVLGVVSYRRASDTIVEKYKESSIRRRRLS